MILLEVVEAERRKVAAALNLTTTENPTRRHPETQQPSSPRLPDYATSQAQAEGQPKKDDIQKPAKWNERRMGRAIIYALVIYLVLSLSIAVPLFIVLRNRSESSDPSNSMNWVKSGPKGPPPPPPDRLPPDVSNLPSVYGTPIECNNWTYIAASGSTDGYYKLQYALPSNETIYLRSNFSEMDDDDFGSPVTGSLNVSVLDDMTQTHATVSVAMKDIGEDALKEANVCLMRTDKAWGLAIYVPDDANEDNYYFDVELTLPLPQEAPLLKGLATYLPSFNQTFKQLDSYNLDSFIVQGSLGSINIESVHAKSVLVKTSAASISGTFNASDKVILETVLAPVTANVSLYNEGNSHPSQLDIESGSSDITLNVTLHSNSTGNSNCQPMFMSSLKTFSGAIEAAYNHDPSLVSSILFVRATNSLEPARVFVDSAFEGTYDVHTTLADAVLDRTFNVTDPTGAGRERIFIDEHVSTNRAFGWVGWGLRPTNQNRHSRQGHIEVVSSLSTAVLQLTDVPDISRLTSSKVSKAVISQA